MGVSPFLLRDVESAHLWSEMGQAWVENFFHFCGREEKEPLPTQSPVQSCSINIAMTCLLDGLLKSLATATSRAIVVLDWPTTPIKSEELDCFVIRNKSLQTKTWIQIQASLLREPSSSGKTTVLVTSSPIFLNALRHKLADLRLFSILIIGSSNSLLSTQNGKLFAENDIYNIFIEFIRRESCSEGSKHRLNIIAPLTPSLIDKASYIAKKSNFAEGALPILAELTAFYLIERWWSPLKSPQICTDLSIVPANLPAASSLQSLLKSPLVQSIKSCQLINTLIGLETQLSSKVALSLLDELIAELASERQSIASLGSEDSTSPSVMQKVWLRDLEQYRLLFSKAREHLLPTTSTETCAIEALLRTLAINEAMWRNLKVVIALQESSHISALANVIASLVASKWHLSIETIDSNQIRASSTSTSSIDDEKLNTLFGSNLLASIDEFGHSIFDKDELNGFKRCIQITSWRGSSSKGPSRDSTLGEVGIVFFIGLPTQAHETSSLMEHYTSSASSLTQEASSSPDSDCSPNLVSPPHPTKFFVIAPSHTLNLINKRLDIALSPSRTQETLSAIAHLTNGNLSSLKSSFEVLKRFIKLPIAAETHLNANGALERSQFSIPSVLSSNDPSSPFNGIHLRCSHLSAHIIVHRWLHRLHSGSLGSASLPRTFHPSYRRKSSKTHYPNRKDASKIDLDPLFPSSYTTVPQRMDSSTSSCESSRRLSSPTTILPSHETGVSLRVNSILWCQGSTHQSTLENNVFALFPSHSPLHGIPFRPLVESSAQYDMSQPLPETLPSGAHNRPTLRDRRFAFLQVELSRLARHTATTAALVVLYAMNQLDDHLRPTWVLPSSTDINRTSCVSHRRYSIISRFLNELSTASALPSGVGAHDIDFPSLKSTASLPTLTTVINKKALNDLASHCSSLKPISTVPEKKSIRPKRGFGAPRPAIPSLSDLLIEGESSEMDESVIVQIEALRVSIELSTDPERDVQTLAQADPSLIAFLKATSADKLNPNVQPMDKTSFAMLTKGAIFPAHRLPHTFPLADKEHRILVCTLETSESIRLSVGQIRKLRFFHHRLFSLFNFAGSADMEASWNRSVYQYVIAPLTIQSTLEIDWKRVEQTICGIPRPSSSTATSDPESYTTQWKEWIGSFVMYEAHPDQRYYVKDIDFSKSPLSPSQLDPSTTIADAMFMKHAFVILDLNQPILGVRMLSTKPCNGLLVTAALKSAQQLNISAPKDAEAPHQPLQPLNHYKFLPLVPEMVTLHSKSFSHDIIAILGSLIYRIETFARIEEVLKDLDVPNLDWTELLTSFSPAVSNEETNFEVLETFGDCVLKLFVASFLSRPDNWSLNNRFGSEIWSHRWISNAHLCTLAMSRNLDLHLNLGYAFATQMITAVKRGDKKASESAENWLKIGSTFRDFSSDSNLVVSAAQRDLRPFSCFISGFEHLHGAQYPSEAANVRLLTEKTIADFAESFLGVLFLGDHIRGANTFFNYFGLPELCLDKSSLDSPSIDKTKDELCLERNLNFSFSNSSLLREALTHESYLDLPPDGCLFDSKHDVLRPKSFHSLCLLGDALFDYLIYIYIRQRFPNATPGDHTHLKSIGVCGCAQAIIATSLDLNHLLRHSSADLSAHLLQFTSTLANAPFTTNDVGRTVPFWRYTGLDYPEPLAMALEALVGATFEDIGRDLKLLERIWIPVLEPFWSKHVVLATKCEPIFDPLDLNQGILPDQVRQPLPHQNQHQLAIESFWPKAFLSSIQQHLNGRKCKALNELSPKRLTFSRAFMVKSTYHNHVSIGIASSKRCAQSDSACRMMISLLHQHPSLILTNGEKLLQCQVIERMEAFCDCTTEGSSSKQIQKKMPK